MGVLKYYWLAVTPDELELPLAVADTAKELAELVGLSVDTVMASEFRKGDGSISGQRFVKVSRE